MPATAGRVRMPANNRVHSSAALQTHGIWQSAIGYDPYAPNKDEVKSSSAAQPTSTNVEPDGENAYASFQGLLALARITGSNADEARGACKKCGRVGHLTFQCRNFLSIKDDKEKDPEAIQAAVMSGLDKLKGGAGKNKGDSEDTEEEDESESSDSDVDSEMERLIARRYVKKASSKGRSLKKEQSDEDEQYSDSERKKRGRSKKRSSRKRISNGSEDEDGGRRKRRREKRRKRTDSSDEDEDEDEEDRRRHRRKSRKEKCRRRKHRHSDNSDSDMSDDSRRRRKQKSRRAAAASDSDPSVSDDSRIGRGTKRSEKRSRKRHYEVDE